MLNFAQLSATLNLRAVMEKDRGGVDEELLGRLQNSASDRNWDSIEALWRMKNEVRDDAELRAAFGAGDATAIAAALRGSERGRRFIAERVEPYQREFGWHAVWSHEFIFPTVREQMEPVLELVRGYLETDYDYPTAIEAMRRDIEAASSEILDGLDGRGARGDARRQRDQPADGAAHARPPLLHRPGRERARPARADRDRPQARRGGPARPARRRDVPALQRAAHADRRRRGARRARDRGAAPRRARRGEAGQAARLGRDGRRRPSSPSRTSSTGATRSGSTRRPSADTTTVKGIAGSPGVVEGIARVVHDRRRVRRGQRRRHPRLPDDEPGVGRAVHEDRRRS